MFHAYTCSEILREIHFVPRNESFSQEKQLIIEVKIYDTANSTSRNCEGNKSRQ